MPLLRRGVPMQVQEIKVVGFEPASKSVRESGDTEEFNIIYGGFASKGEVADEKD